MSKERDKSRVEIQMLRLRDWCCEASFGYADWAMIQEPPDPWRATEAHGLKLTRRWDDHRVQYFVKVDSEWMKCFEMGTQGLETVAMGISEPWRGARPVEYFWRGEG